MKPAGTRRQQSAFTLVEVMVASALGGVIFLALMSGFSVSFQRVQISRENSRATQLLMEKTELVRLYNWDQITGADTNTFIPTNFTAPYYPDARDGGFTYSGTVTVTNVPITETYSNSMRMVTVALTWNSGNMTHTRVMNTWISRYGLQNYIY